MKKAFEKVSKLSEKDKKAFAAFIIEEVELEDRWQDLYKKSESQLESLANEALLEHKKGKTIRVVTPKF